MTPSTSTTTSTSVTARRSIIRPRPTGSSSIVSVMAEPPLPEEVVVAIHSPYSLLPNQDGENESIDSSVSGSSQEATNGKKEEDNHGSTTGSCPQSPQRPRSIFGSYWQAEGGDSPATRTKMVVPPARALSPKSVLAPPNSSAMDDFKDLLRYGLEIPMEEDGHDDDMSVNTYERMLKDCEQPAALPLLSVLSPYHNEPLWTSWFGGAYHRHSEPSLRHYPQGRRISRSRQTQSDSALLPSPMGSALRRGRFSSSCHMGGTPASTTTTTSTTPCPQKDAAAPQPRRQVRFQARIQVHSYQPPVESWAAEGWSQWFGI